MKLNKIIFPLAAASLLMTGCYDEKMDWHTPDGHGAVVSSDIPLALAEQIANYDYAKNYMTKYMPNTPICLGIGADKYLSDTAYAAVANANFQMFTAGNAMKHSSVVKNDGSLNLATVSQFLTKCAENNIKVFGHNFIWHTQQNATYLKSLVAPLMTVKSDGDIANLLTGDNSDFEGGTKGSWGSWGNSSTSSVSASGEGYESNYSATLVNPTDASEYSAQFAYTFNEPLVVGKTYLFRFKAKSTSPAGTLQVCAQNSTDYSGEGYYSSPVGTDWVTFEHEYTCTKEGMNRILINFGKVAATYYVDNIEFGEKVVDPMDNIFAGDDSDFEGGTSGSWGSWGNSSTKTIADEGYNSSKSMLLTNPTDADQWSAQCAYTFDTPLINGKTYIIQFWAKSDVAGATLQFQTQNSTTYGSQEGYSTFNLTTDWVQYEHEYTCSKDDVDRILLNFGKYGAKYYIDNIKFGVKKSAEAKRKAAMRKASSITYTFKTPAEKREALLGAMKTWISGMAAACPEVKQWDVVNEPITDGNNVWRGLDGKGWSDEDTTPVEDEKTGLTIDWADGHWYWAYYVGKDYAVKAFQYAREAVGSDAVLYVNDYNLEKSPSKLDALIEFANYIDQNGGKVDGIGTQMHLTYNQVTKEEVDAMFQKLAATGKMIRVSELDVAMGTATPSTEQAQAQSDVYKMVIESYKNNIPEAQRGGFCIWSLSDAADEHTYWLPDDAPNIFDKNYARKIAYKGVCDGIAGEDIGSSFGGDLWPNYYK